MTITPAYTDNQWLIDAIQNRPTPRNVPTVPEFAETTIIARGKYRGMRHDNSRSPFSTDIMYHCSPQSPTQLIWIMGGAQWGKTVVLSLVAAFYTKTEPSEILYISGAESSSEKFAEREYMQRCLALGVKFRAQTNENKSRKSGNTATTKEFDGGNIDFATANSINQISSDTKRIVLLDEVDRWATFGGEDLGKEGSKYDNILARAKQWGDQKKIIGVSTPTTESESFMNQLFLTGDQCYFQVPCPLCGKMQILGQYEIDGYGLTFKTQGGIVLESSVEYVCKHCSKAFKEIHKSDMLISGEWQPSAIPQPYTKSYQVNSGLLSNFYPWTQTCTEWNQVANGIMSRQSYWNLSRGMAFKEIGTTPKIETLFELRSDYHSGQVPDGVLFLTMGADVQRGSDKYRDMSDAQLNEIIAQQNVDKLEKSDLPRVELEVLGTCAQFKTRSICYKRFYGRVTDPLMGAWAKFADWIETGGMQFYDKRGRLFEPKLTFIDSGDGYSSMDAVLVFCTAYQHINFYGIKGQQLIKRGKNEKSDQGDDIGTGFKRYRASKSGGQYDFYLINTQHYKTIQYRNFKITDPQMTGSCLFPRDYSDFYFDMFTAEELVKENGVKLFKKMSGRANEAIDCRVYALCAADVWVEKYFIPSQQLYYKERGATPAQLVKVDKAFCIQELDKYLWG